MQNLSKIKKLNEQKAEKLYAMSQLQAKKSKIEQKASILKKRQSLAESTLESSALSQVFIIKNLDKNETQYYMSDRQMEDALLKDVDSLPEIEKILECFWEKYLTDKEKEQEDFLEACFQGDFKKIKKTTSGKNKYPIQPRSILTAQCKNGIHLATVSGSYRKTEIIELLIDFKVDINGKTQPEKRTPLMIGCITGNDIAVKSLIELGAKVNEQDYEGNTALHFSCLYNQQPLIQLLIKSKASLEIKNDRRQKPLNLIQNNQLIQLLVEKQLISESFMKNSEKKQQIDRATKQNSFDNSPLPFSKIEKVAIEQIGLSSFKKVSILGRGAFGQVYLTQNVHNQEKYAIKVLDKVAIMRQNILRYAMTERKILSTINHPFIVKLKFAFQSSDKLFLVMDFCSGGDMLNLIKKKGRIEEKMLKKYMAQIALAIDALHRAEIIYRDLKPGNVIIDSQGHACLTDFGLSKQASLAHSFCGSTAYLAPEMLWRRGHTKVLDWYLFGVLIYEGLTGRPPFWDSNKQQLLANIKSGKYKPLNSQFSKQVRDLIQKLLRSNSNKRLGAKGIQQIKSHSWFKQLNWKDVENRKMVHQKLDQVNGKLVKGQYFQQGNSEYGNKIKGWDYIPK